MQSAANQAAATATQLINASHQAYKTNLNPSSNQQMATAAEVSDRVCTGSAHVNNINCLLFYNNFGSYLRNILFWCITDCSSLYLKSEVVHVIVNCFINAKVVGW